MVRDTAVDYLLSGMTSNEPVTIETNNEIEYFVPDPNKENDERASANITKQIQKEFEEVFMGIGCFEGMFSLHVKPDNKPYQVPSRHVAYALQKLFKEGLEKLQRQDIITPLGMDETLEWCNSFILVPKAKSKVRVCLDLAKLIQVLIRPVHRAPTLNDIFLKLNNVKYLSLIDVSSGYHNIKLDNRLSYLTTFTHQFGNYRYKTLPFGAAATGDMFQHMVDEIFKDLPNVFGIGDDILVEGYDSDGKDHEETLWWVLQIYRHVNLKLNRDKCHFRCTPVLFFGEVISRLGVQPNPQKLKVLTNVLPPKTKKEPHAFLGIINYLVKFSPRRVEICESLS